MRFATLAFSFLTAHFLPAQSPVSIQLVDWAQGFFAPTDIANAGDSRIFVAQQPGFISIVTDSNTVLPTPFLDISAKVTFTGEQGLLGLAFDPAYASNGFFYVHYVADDSLGHRSVVSRFTVSTGDPDQADPLSEAVLYTWPQVSVAHKGGDLVFAPDSTLFISLGDGSAGGDPFNVAQNLSDPLGAILRIRPEANGTWTVPPDNPFANAGPDTLREIWAYGLRNPFRISVDPEAGALWIGDVGQSSFDEVDRWPLADNTGPNFGWRCREGMVAYDTTLCDTGTAFVDPLAVEANILGGGTWCALAGGSVYRGTRFPRLLGRYFFVDYCTGQVRSVRPDGQGAWTEEVMMQAGPVGLVCIQEDEDRELFAVSNFEHKLYRIIDPCPPLPAVIVSGDTLLAAPGVAHAWYMDGTLLPAEVSATLVPQLSGNYWALVDQGNGCVLYTDTVAVLISAITEIGASPRIGLHPNPAATQATITWDDATWGKLRVDAQDATGRLVRSWACANGSAVLDLAGLRPGCLVLRVATGAGASAHARLMIQ